MLNPLDPFGIADACLQVQKAWLTHSRQLGEELTHLGTEAWAQQPWQGLVGNGQAGDPIPAAEYDERFADRAWSENPFLTTVKEAYLLFTRWLEDAIYKTPGVSENTRHKSAFWVRQYLNAIAPSNFFWTNPVALRRFFESGGASAVHGWQQFISDMHKGSIRIVDETAFEVGRNIATTEGAVVFRNELVEMIQYTPTTDKVREIPIVIVTAWINKYYILDINPQRSLVRYLLDQGFTVFITSWKNPGPEQADTQLEDYMLRGALEVVNAAREISGTQQVHLVGYCIGGTITASLLAWLGQPTATDSEINPVAHGTQLASLVDFSNPGDIESFIDEESIEAIEHIMTTNGGYLDGSAMANSFRTVRSNSLIWHYWIQNYLYGEPLPKWDVLFWNTDCTRLPQAMHSFYLRELYLHNKLAQKNGVTLGGRPIDLGNIAQPLYVVGTEQDHIAPWRSTFQISHLVNGPVRYILATSGHIMGILSPPVEPPKRRYWASPVNGYSDPSQWQAATGKVAGSWWTDWTEWLHKHCGEYRSPRKLGGDTHSRLAEAPGTYVLEH